MSTSSVPQGTDGAPTSAADPGFCGGLAGCLGTKPSRVETAFPDEPAQRDDPEEPARTVIARAKTRGAGASGPVQGGSIPLAGGAGRGGEAHRRENGTLAGLFAGCRYENPVRLGRVPEEPEIRASVFPERPEDVGGS